MPSTKKWNCTSPGSSFYNINICTCNLPYPSLYSITKRPAHIPYLANHSPHFERSINVPQRFNPTATGGMRTIVPNTLMYITAKLVARSATPDFWRETFFVEGYFVGCTPLFRLKQEHIFIRRRRERREQCCMPPPLFAVAGKKESVFVYSPNFVKARFGLRRRLNQTSIIVGACLHSLLPL